jgi:hypothetical protein
MHFAYRARSELRGFVKSGNGFLRRTPCTGGWRRGHPLKAFTDRDVIRTRATERIDNRAVALAIAERVLPRPNDGSWAMMEHRPVTALASRAVIHLSQVKPTAKLRYMAFAAPFTFVSCQERSKVGTQSDCFLSCSSRKLLFSKDGGQGRNRTTDTRIFSPLLYQLSYLADGGEKDAY